MSWENRPYASGETPYHGEGGARSWLGGLPRPTKAVKWILFANIGMFFLCLITGGSRSPIYEALEMNTSLVLRGHVWRLFTYSYLHDQSSVSHIFWNMLALYMLGIYLERAWGARRFVVFYSLGAFVAVVAYMLITLVGWLDDDVPLVGASGGVLTVLGACAVLFPHIRLFMFFPIPIRAAVLLFTAMYSVNLIMKGHNAGGDACHLAGMAFGVAWGYRGERWWQAWSSMGDAMRQRAADAKRRQEESLLLSVDQILDKVRDRGIQSLTSREKSILEEATKRQQAGRNR
ncbi:MAG: rhomboid family intramembrane serine protease [Planctomycetes bacterium]|nr:rhomboid family intramembrane serine protease [Planctomycetota bacterium]